MNHQIGDVVFYVAPDNLSQLEVRFVDQQVWLNRQQLAALYGRDVKTIGKHVNNALSEELDGISVVAKFATTAADGKSYLVEHYNLDLILSVGYRVKSPEGIKFRQWASRVLSQYALDGVALNKQRLEELGSIVRVLRRSDNELVSGVADVIAEYLPGLELLREYDEGQIQNTKYGTTPGWQLDLDQARQVIAQVGSKFPQDRLFGIERSEQLEGIIAAIYQGFGDADVYPTVEEKAANLLYFIIKDHPLSDGNKRSAAAIFVTFLERNKILFDNKGLQKVSNNALAAITLLLATSDPREKDLMVALVMRMVSNNG